MGSARLFSSSAPLRWEEGTPVMGKKSHIFSLLLLAGTSCSAPADGGHHAVHVEGHEEYDEEISITYIEECEERVYETCDESVTEIHHNQHPVSHSTHVTADNYRYTPTEVIHLVKRSAEPAQYQPGYHKQEPRCHNAMYTKCRKIPKQESKRTPYHKCEKIPHEECTPVYHEECHP